MPGKRTERTNRKKKNVIYQFLSFLIIVFMRPMVTASRDHLQANAFFSVWLILTLEKNTRTKKNAIGVGGDEGKKCCHLLIQLMLQSLQIK